MTPVPQDSLFPDQELPLPPGLVRIVGSKQKLGRAQREFNRLTERIAKLREEVSQWRTAMQAIQVRAEREMEPLRLRSRAARREIVLWIDGFLADPPKGQTPPPAQRRRLVKLLCLLAVHVLDDGPDAEVEAAHDRHSEATHADAQRDAARATADYLSEMTGDDDLFDGDAASVDELLSRARERMQARGPEAGFEPPGASTTGKKGRRPSARQQAARERAEAERVAEAQAQQDASQAMRDVYRKLASSLHPDRATDAEDRAWRTERMAQANQAYEARDLLSLLSLQIEIEQVSATQFASLPDERLAHFNRVLAEQCRVLEAEIQVLQEPLMDRPALARRRRLTPDLLEVCFDADLEVAGDMLASIEQDGWALRDPKQRKRILAEMDLDEDVEYVDVFDGFFLDEMAADLDDERAPSKPGRKVGPGGAGRKKSARAKRR